MKGKTRFVTVIVILACLVCTPLGAQLEEAGRVAWPGFQVLKGLWRSLDGRGVFDIKHIDPTGSMEVQYFDPGPVQVITSQAARDGQLTKILIKLRNPSSPCCIYDLTYDSGSDRLKGVYWQKTDSKSTEIIFIRAK
jgi:hypothetical protein